MPDLKYKKGKVEPNQLKAQRKPNLRSTKNLPQMYRKGSTIRPKKALGKRAAYSPIPKMDIESACNQKKSGGFSVKLSKLIVICNQFPRSTISRANSAKLISSQSKRCTPPKKGRKKIAAIRIQNQVFLSKYFISPLEPSFIEPRRTQFTS